MTKVFKNNDGRCCGIQKRFIFATVKRVQSFRDIGLPISRWWLHTPETNGFSLFRPHTVASPRQGRKSRAITLIHDRGTLANSTAMLTSINLLNLFQGLTCKPVREPKLYYTDTSFDAIGRVSQFSLGGRGLTYFFLTYYLPFPFFCNSLNLLNNIQYEY